MVALVGLQLHQDILCTAKLNWTGSSAAIFENTVEEQSAVVRWQV